MLYRLLISDDEKIVIDAVSFIIDKNFKDILYETARSGREAIEKSDSFKPDIVLMDIRMPGINGIEAIKEIKDRLPNTLFIIVSAYEQFEYAKEAVKIGVIDYILKPINKENLINALKKAVEMINSRREKLENDIENLERYERVLPLIEHNFIYSILLGNEVFFTGTKNKELLSIKSQGGYIMVIELHDKDFNVFDQNLYTYVRDVLKYKCQCLVGPVIINRIVVLICADYKEEYDQRLESFEIAEYIVNRINQYTKVIETSIGIGSYRSMENITLSYGEALNALNYGRMKDINHIMDIKGGSYHIKQFPMEQEKKLMEMCYSGETQGAISCFYEIFRWIYDEYKNLFDEGKNRVLEVMVAVHRSVREEIINTDYYNDYIFDLLSQKDYSELENWCRERIITICSHINKNKEKNINKIIVKAKAYIEKNYSSEITLAEISREICVSPHYFSRLFKEETGENFIEYLTKIRIKKAKELMKTTDLTVKEICYKIGYNDPNYFSRLFKKVEKISPSEYLRNITVE